MNVLTYLLRFILFVLGGLLFFKAGRLKERRMVNDMFEAWYIKDPSIAEHMLKVNRQVIEDLNKVEETLQ
jgi:hypothetical protein